MNERTSIQAPGAHRSKPEGRPPCAPKAANFLKITKIVRAVIHQGFITPPQTGAASPPGSSQEAVFDERPKWVDGLLLVHLGDRSTDVEKF